MASLSDLASISPSTDKYEVDLSSLVRSIWRGKFWILLCGFLAAFLGGYYVFSVATPIYTAHSVVALVSRKEQVVDLESVVSGLGGDQITINTEVEVLRSRTLYEKLALKLDLINDPEFNPPRTKPTGFSIGRVIGAVRELVRGPRPEPKPLSEQAILDKVVNKLLQLISVSNIRQSYVFQITVRTKSAEKSALLANTLADIYVLDQVETKFEATKQATLWLTDRVGQLQIELETAESAVKAFNAKTELVSPEALNVLNFQIKELRDRLQEVESTAATAEERVNILGEAQARGDVLQMVEVADDRSLNRIYGFIKDNPDADPSAFDTRFQQVLDRAALDLSRANSQISTLNSTIEVQRAQIERQSVDLVELQQLQREAEANRLIYEYFLGRLKETSVQQGIQQADSRVLSRAIVPSGPSAPRKSMIIVLSFMMGAMISIGLVLLREFSQTTFRTADELEARTGHAVLGQVPAIPIRNRKGILKYLIEKPTSAAVEAIRNLRTSLLLSNVDNPPQIIMSTSSITGEGKTTQSLALAQNLSALGKSVLLIEGDIRRRVFTEYFQSSQKRGLISVLSGNATLEEIVLHEASMGIDILIGEKSSTNAADLFSSERFKTFIKDLRSQYDYVIIDTPPVLAVPDARVIGHSVDAILYTVKWDSTTHRQVNEGLKAFETVNLKVTGLILGQINSKGMKKYGYGSSYAAYSSYYDN